jgi:hypothetical protein
VLLIACGADEYWCDGSLLVSLRFKWEVLCCIRRENLDATVNLSNTNDNIGRYLVHITVYGKETLEQSKVIDTSNQTCPDDIESLCYVSAGTFSFASKLVPLNSKIQVCVEELSSGTENCVYGKNSETNTPETIIVGVPQILSQR